MELSGFADVSKALGFEKNRHKGKKKKKTNFEVGRQFRDSTIYKRSLRSENSSEKGQILHEGGWISTDFEAITQIPTRI